MKRDEGDGSGSEKAVTERARCPAPPDVLAKKKIKKFRAVFSLFFLQQSPLARQRSRTIYFRAEYHLDPNFVESPQCRRPSLSCKRTLRDMSDFSRHVPQSSSLNECSIPPIPLDEVS